MESQIRKEFPLLFPKTRDYTEFDGFINVLGMDVPIQISIKAHTIIVKEQGNLCGLPKPRELERNWDKNSSLLDFLHNLKEKLEIDVKAQVQSNVASPVHLPFVIESLAKLGWERVESMDEELKCVVLKAFDEGNRKHLLQVYFPVDKTVSSITCVSDLPEPLAPSLQAQKNLRVLYTEFEEALKLYQCFWDELEEIDQNTWVLEPENPMRKENVRRIALSKKMSLQLTIDVCRPTSAPECEFYGPEKDVSPLRTLLLSNSESSWDEDQSVLWNLRNILGIDFPSALTTTKEDVQEICVICYSFRLNDSLPDKTCENDQCGQTFHMECLYEWLYKLPTTRHSFNILFGECPYCNKPITCKML